MSLSAAKLEGIRASATFSEPRNALPKFGPDDLTGAPDSARLLSMIATSKALEVVEGRVSLEEFVAHLTYTAREWKLEFDPGGLQGTRRALPPVRQAVSGCDVL
jgi:hypothetical protein